MSELARIFEGTWEELSARAGAFAGRRVRLIVLSEKNESDGVSQDVNAAEALRRAVGSLHLGTAALSENCGARFTEILAEQRSHGREKMV